jgi:hypothetical protein
MLLVIGTMTMLSTSTHAQGISWDGAGPVRLGMTVEEAERALEAKLAPRDRVYLDESCWVTSRADGKDKDVSYMIWKGKVAAIAEFPGNKGPQANLADAHGIGIGAAEADIGHAYPQMTKRRAPNSADDAGTDAKSGPGTSPEFWIEAESADHEREIIFDTRDGKVTEIMTGLKPMVADAEWCP